MIVVKSETRALYLGGGCGVVSTKLIAIESREGYVTIYRVVSTFLVVGGVKLPPHTEVETATYAT
tara:strand:+ start:532 stop:726 length:195 start_codon:yes stop_codon:yes gene_type:complete